MGGEPERRRSDLFLLRLWTDETDEQVDEGKGDEVSPRHGRLLNVHSGEGHNFEDWPELIDLLRKMLSPRQRETE